MTELRNLALLMLSLTVFACSSGSGSGSSDDVPADPAPTSTDDFQVSGSVGDGPIVNGTITAVDAEGNTVATAVSDAEANYSIGIPVDAALPVTLSVTGGTDLVTDRPADFELRSLINAVGVQTVNVSPLTTLVVHAAECVDDTSDSRIADLWQGEHADVGMGLDANVFGDPMRDGVTASNVESAVLANEALGEWVRRIGAAMSSAGMSTGLDTIVTTLACDLADGAMDGQMAAPVGANDDRVLAVAKAAEVAVRIEVLAGQLHVDHQDATGAMNSSISTIMSGMSGADVNSVALSAGALAQTTDALAVLQGVYGDAALMELMSVLDGVSAGSVRAALGSALDAANHE